MLILKKRKKEARILFLVMSWGIGPICVVDMEDENIDMEDDSIDMGYLVTLAAESIRQSLCGGDLLRPRLLRSVDGRQGLAG